MRSAIVSVTIAIAVALGSRSLAGTLAPGCLPEDFKDLQKLSVRFGGRAPSESVARFYEFLRSRDALPCRRVALDKSQPTLSHVLTAAGHRVTPPPYTVSLDQLICRLNAARCMKDRPFGHDFVVPDVHLEAHFPVWASLPLNPDEDPEKDLDVVLKRHNYSLPEAVDERAWRDKIAKANFGFKRSVTQEVKTQRGVRLKQRQLLVPITEYRTTMSLPKSVASIPEDEFGIADFSFDADAYAAPSVRTDGSGTPGPLATRFSAALQVISMPPRLPRAESDPAIVLIADRGIDPECVFLRPDRDISSEILAAATNGGNVCTKTAHGTHIWGIIGGRIPDIMTGVALEGRVPLEILHWDFDKQPPGQAADFVDFVNASVPAVRVANLSIDFDRDVTRSQVNRFVQMVKHTPTILYVVAAENTFTKYERDTVLSLPVSLHAKENVVVVTALNESGTAVWEKAARNASENDDVVLLAAPGVGIPSACANNRVGTLDGTSQATAFVSGVAALLVRDGLDQSAQVKRRLAYTADVLPALVDGVAGGRLNVSRALGAGRDKLCSFTDGDGIRCSKWKPGVAHLGYHAGGGFKSARSVVLKGEGGQKLAEVSPASRILRVARQDGGKFAVFYLQSDDSMPDQLRRKHATALQAFGDPNNHGSLVIRFDRDDRTSEDVDLTMLGDFVRRGK